jgi:uncharacterized damage-inducible protein DinB
MASSRTVLARTIGNALSGRGSHVATRNVFDGLGWRLAGVRPRSTPHSIYQVLNHMSYWQDWVVRWLDGEDPPVPKHASGGWPGSPQPTDSKEWQRAVRGFKSGLMKLDRQSRRGDLVAARGKHTRLGMLQALASHNSYHLGQVVLLRQILGSWPPPSGGLTW